MSTATFVTKSGQFSRSLAKIAHSRSFSSSSNLLDGNKPYSGNFRGGSFNDRKKASRPRPKPEETNQKSEWSSVWQGQRAFDPYVVPFPIHMGFPLKGKDPPPPVGNLELMKIPNFLHLTPPAIHKHCAALKPLCTPWPQNLPSLPLKIETKNYVFPSHSVKHPGSRTVTMEFNLSDLNLNERARNKMIKLSGPRYKPDRDIIRLVADRCPTRQQNRDYVMYLLKVLYLESNRVEPWELEPDEEVDDFKK